MKLKTPAAVIVAAALGITVGAGLPRTHADTVKPTLAQDTTNAALIKRLDVLEKRVQQLELNQNKSSVTTFVPDSRNGWPSQPRALAPEWRVVPLSKSDTDAK